MSVLDGQSVFHVSVFSGDYHGKLFAGTEALVFLEDEALSSEVMQVIAKRKDIPAIVFVWPAENPSQFHIRFYNPECEIQLCGHGLLAAAKVLFEISHANQSSKTPITFITQSSHVIASIDENQAVWVGFEPVAIEEAAVPNWADDCCNIIPYKGSKVGLKDGYWIFEWPNDFDLTQLAIDFDKLTFATERALIATTRSQANGFDYDLRYFAPQHGVNEDKATGSANRVLATYWQKKLHQTHFKARQLSPDGAVIDIKIEALNTDTVEINKVESQNEMVWISGKVTIDA